MEPRSIKIFRSRATHTIILFVSFDIGIVPDLLPELGRPRYTPLPEVIVVLKRKLVLLIQALHEIIYLGTLRI
jgi:hypothetical protein